jgi:ketosteroid isomerase-like protein
MPAGKDAAGNATPAMRDEEKFMHCLTKQADGTWKITRDMWNSNLPAPGVAAR